MLIFHFLSPVGPVLGRMAELPPPVKRCYNRRPSKGGLSTKCEIRHYLIPSGDLDDKIFKTVKVHSVTQMTIIQKELHPPSIIFNHQQQKT